MPVDLGNRIHDTLARLELKRHVVRNPRKLVALKITCVECGVARKQPCNRHLRRTEVDANLARVRRHRVVRGGRQRIARRVVERDDLKSHIDVRNARSRIKESEVSCIRSAACHVSINVEKGQSVPGPLKTAFFFQNILPIIRVEPTGCKGPQFVAVAEERHRCSTRKVTDNWMILSNPHVVAETLVVLIL